MHFFHSSFFMNVLKDPLYSQCFENDVYQMIGHYW